MTVLSLLSQLFSQILKFYCVKQQLWYSVIKLLNKNIGQLWMMANYLTLHVETWSIGVMLLKHRMLK